MTFVREARHENCHVVIDSTLIGMIHRLFANESVDPWLLGHNRLCPICKRDVTLKSESVFGKDRYTGVSIDIDDDDEMQQQQEQGMLLYKN